MKYTHFMYGQTTPSYKQVKLLSFDMYWKQSITEPFRGPKENSRSHLTSSAYPIPTIRFACGLIDYYRQSIFR